jgi:hypothetical protein
VGSAGPDANKVARVSENEHAVLYPLDRFGGRSKDCSPEGLKSFSAPGIVGLEKGEGGF